jgi:hypothetical protein
MRLRISERNATQSATYGPCARRRERNHTGHPPKRALFSMTHSARTPMAASVTSARDARPVFDMLSSTCHAAGRIRITRVVSRSGTRLGCPDNRRVRSLADPEDLLLHLGQPLRGARCHSQTARSAVLARTSKPTSTARSPRACGTRAASVVKRKYCAALPARSVRSHHHDADVQPELHGREQQLRQVLEAQPRLDLENEPQPSKVDALRAGLRTAERHTAAVRCGGKLVRGGAPRRGTD